MMRLCSLFLGSVMACVLGILALDNAVSRFRQRNVMGDIQKMEHVYERVGKEVVIEGKAENTKMGAVVIGNDFGVYLDESSLGPKTLMGKRLEPRVFFAGTNKLVTLNLYRDAAQSFMLLRILNGRSLRAPIEKGEDG